MNVIALIPFRNESLFLPACLQSLQGIADEILGFDDGSTDDSKAIFEAYGGLVKTSSSAVASWAVGKEAEVRNSLLAWGRERGGTHFIWLDADEAFTTPFRGKARDMMEKLEPGHKLFLQWLATWKNPRVYRCDPPQWNEPYKDFIVCDEPSLQSFEGFMHFGRTHGSNSSGNSHRVPLEDGAVLHFQYAAWNQFQMKQCWYRCAELRKRPGGEELINEIYSLTLDDPAAHCVAVPGAWIEGLPLPQEMDSLPPSWHLQEILGMFDDYGADSFEGLDIWHVPELCEAFVQRCGRRPNQHSALRSLRWRRAVKDVCKKMLPDCCVAAIRNIKNTRKSR